MSDQILRLARLGVWALPIYAATLFAGTVTHQPPPQTQLADWSRYVTTNEFLIGHIVFSIFGSIFGAIGAVALGTRLIERGSVKLGLAGVLSGLSANVIGTSIFGIAAFAQAAIGRLYLSGQTQTARDVYYDAAQGTPMVVVALVFIVLLVAITTGRLIFGMFLIVAFGVGMALVLGGLAVVTTLLRTRVRAPGGRAATRARAQGWNHSEGWPRAVLRIEWIWRTPSVRLAGPGCRMYVDLIS